MLYEFGCIGPTLLDGRFLHLVPDIRLVGRHDDGKDKEDDEAHFIGLHIPTERALKACTARKRVSLHLPVSSVAAKFESRAVCSRPT
jgi:hypothetical protein